MTLQTPRQYGPLGMALATALGVASGIIFARWGFKLPMPLKGG